MKLATYERTSDYYDNIQSAALKGALLGGVISVGLRSFIIRKSPSVLRQAGGYHRALLYAGPTAFCMMTNMEMMSTEYEKRHHPEGIKELHQGQPSRTLRSILSEYRYQAIVAGWAAAMAGSYLLVNRDPFITRAQKLVQARVYAQGITVLMLLASVAFSVSNHNTAERTEQKREHSARSWERNLDYLRRANIARY